MNKKWLIIGAVVGGLVLIIAVVVVLSLFQKVSPVTLNVWGLWEESGVYQEVIADYQKAHPNVAVKYQKQSPDNYRDRLGPAINGTNGPDVFFIHNTWLPMVKNLLSPMPNSVYSPAEYKTVFYPVITTDFISGGKAYGVPLEIDDLALYVNMDILNAAGVTVPAVWDGDNSFVTAAQKMTVRDSNGRIRTAGAALGTASNVDHWQDIVTLMMFQSGVELDKDPGSQEAANTLEFYVAFARDLKVWDETLDTSTLAFSQGKLGMYFGPSWRFFDFKALNPNLNFKVVAVPKLTGADTVNVATYWGATVSKNSRSQVAAWDFIKFASSKDELTKAYSAASKSRAFGQPYPRVDMAEMLLTDPNVGAFINGAGTARSWYLASYTHDGETGINTRIGKYYQDAINSVLRQGDSKTAMTTVAQGVAQVLQEYK